MQPCYIADLSTVTVAKDSFLDSPLLTHGAAALKCCTFLRVHSLRKANCSHRKRSIELANTHCYHSNLPATQYPAKRHLHICAVCQQLTLNMGQYEHSTDGTTLLMPSRLSSVNSLHKAESAVEAGGTCLLWCPQAAIDNQSAVPHRPHTTAASHGHPHE
jgi:hypothetical protein